MTRFHQARKANDVEALRQVLGDLEQLGAGAAPAVTDLHPLEQSRDPAGLQEEVREVFAAMGIAASRELIEAARESDTHRAALNAFIPRHENAAADCAALFNDPDEWVQIWAGALLANLGESGVEAWGEVLRSGSSAQRERAARAGPAFTYCQEQAVPHLVACLGSDNPRLRYWATFGLSGLVPASTPALLDALQHEDPRVRRAAAEGIERSVWHRYMDPESEESNAYVLWHGKPRDIIPPFFKLEDFLERGKEALALALHDTEEEVRGFAAMALYKLTLVAHDWGEPEASLDLAEWERYSDDPSPLVRFWARASAGILKHHPWCTSRLLAESWEGTDDRPELTEAELAELRRQVDQGGSWDLVGFPDEWEWPSVDERWDAAKEILTRSGPQLFEQARSDDEEIAEKAAGTLDLLDAAASWRIQTLLNVLEESKFRSRAAVEILELRPATDAAIGQEFLRFPRFPVGPPVFLPVLWVLEDMGFDALPVLLEGLEHWQVSARAYSAQAIGKLGSGALPAVPHIISAWRYGSPIRRVPGLDSFWDREQAMWPTNERNVLNDRWRLMGCAGMIAEIGEQAVPFLLQALEDEHSVVRRRACDSLALLEASSDAVLASLAPLLSDEQPSVQKSAAHAVQSLAPESPLALEAKDVLERLERK